MIDYKISGFSYREGETDHIDKFVVEDASITLHCSGIRSYRVRGEYLDCRTPFLCIHPPGTSMELGNAPGRRSWAICFDTDEIRNTSEAATVEVFNNGSWIPLPAITHLTSEECVLVESEFQKLNQWQNIPSPLHSFRMRLGFIKILRTIIDKHLATTVNSPAAMFKRLIDRDEHLESDLESLSRQCGYSANHLRVLFEQEFGITPLKYRNQLRMTRASMMIHNTDMSLKEIALATGFRNVSHFSRMFRRTFGMPPSTVKRRSDG